MNKGEREGNGGTSCGKCAVIIVAKADCAFTANQLRIPVHVYVYMWYMYML